MFGLFGAFTAAEHRSNLDFPSPENDQNAGRRGLQPDQPGYWSHG